MPLVRPNVLSTAGYIPGEQPLDDATIKLNTNENPYPPSPKAIEAIRAVSPEQLRRYPSPNARHFREAAARVHGVSPDQIMAFNGGDELLTCAIRASAGEQDNVAFLDPSYSLYPILTDIQGARKISIPYELANNQWQLPATIESTNAALLLIVNPNAPTGHLNPLSRIEQIARSFKGLLLLDEAYIDFAGPDASALPLLKDLHLPNVLILRTMSKGYSLAGLRFGYAIGPRELLAQLEKVRESYPVDAIAQAAATAAIEDQAYARDTWQKVISERTRLTTALETLGFSIPESKSNFLLATIPSKRGITAKGLYESLKGKGILVRYWDLPRIADKLRITIGTPAQNDRLLVELKTLV